MPVTLMDRLPLPNLKVYSAGSVLLLSIAVYYAVNVTSDPNWRTNATLQKQQDVHMEAADIDGARNFTEQMMEVMTFMIQEPLCMWTLINMSWCLLAVGGWAVVRAVFGRLRVGEAQRAKDKLWNYVFYKFIFVFGVLNVHYLDELLLWCAWFTLLGALTLLTQLAKDRFEYLSSSPTSSSWAHGRLVALLAGELIAGTALMAVAVRWGLPAGRDTFAFMAAECVIAMVPCVHVVARFVLRALGVDVFGFVNTDPALVDETENINTDPALVDEAENINTDPALIDENEPISTDPALVDKPVPAGSPLVQVIINIKSASSPALKPEDIDNSPAIIPETPIIPDPIIIAQPELPLIPDPINIGNPVLPDLAMNLPDELH